YSKGHSGPALPWTLRDSAHIFTTEAIAMLFGRFATHPAWLRDMKIIDQTEEKRIRDASFQQLKLAQLVFSRWAQVMYRFEKGMYDNPTQDLNALWWKLVEKYQLVPKPEGRNVPDWASKIHIATFPCYYHNYLLGELLASQLYYTVGKKVLKEKDWKNLSWAGRPEVGNFLKANVFMPGKKWDWNDMIKKATGEVLTPKYYALQFVK
ncbi:MAG: M2 family metallopeptidase, partial [Pseudomonadota bacterium]